MAITTKGNAAVSNTQDVFGESVSDFDPWADDDFGGSGADGFGDLPPTKGGNDFFKDDFTVSTASLAQSESPDPSQNPLDESDSLEKDNSTSNHKSCVNPDLTSPASRSGRSDRSKSISRRKLSSKGRTSSQGNNQLAADATAASEESDTLELGAQERKSSSSAHRLRRHSHDDGSLREEGPSDRTRPPSLRRRSSTRRAMMDGVPAPIKRASLSKSADRSVVSDEEKGEEALHDVETEKDHDVGGLDRRSMLRSRRESFRVTKRGNMDKETDQGKDFPKKATVDIGLSPPSVTNNRRAAMAPTNHRQPSSRRLGGSIDRKLLPTQHSVRNLFRGDETKEAETETSPENDDVSNPIVSRSVLQRSLSRRGSLTRSTSISLVRSPDGDAARRTVSRSSSIHRRRDGGDNTALGGQAATERRGPPQRSVSSLVRRPSSVRASLTGKEESPEGGVGVSQSSNDQALPSRNPRLHPPPRSASMNGSLSQRRLQSRLNKAPFSNEGKEPSPDEDGGHHPKDRASAPRTETWGTSARRL